MAKEITNPTAKAWYEKASKFIEGQAKDKQTLHVLTIDSPELDAWVYYFAKLGWQPVFMRMLLSGQTEAVTVPAKLPEWFDLAYVPPSPIPPRVQRSAPPRLSRETYEELKARFGPNWGLNLIEEAKTKAKQYRPPTDDELRARYASRKAAE